MTKAHFIKTLQNEGFKPKYSGKTKTFYIHSLPTGNTLIDIEKAGFNCKW